MSRKKVKLQWISNDAARRATFKKRRKGMIKKAAELSTLCGVNACLIVYGDGEQQPEIWPSAHDAAIVLSRLKRLPEMEQIKQMMNQEGFMRQRLAKLQEQVRKQERENGELETTLLLRHGLAGRSMHGVASRSQLANLAWLIDRKMCEVRRRIESLRRSSVMPPPEAVKKEAASASPAPEAKEKKALEAATEELQPQEWLLPFFEHGNGAWLDACFLKN
ncbi:Agamous-like MADS-box protein AGL80 [Platanthera guangdongensis]|uniref:Agamous-like MADS-box protein AGL80 n=1 Tax=Platanthera guangdongensis TaxID=2320717 RepID=A0ABR2MVQ3_9ASPA